MLRRPSVLSAIRREEGCSSTAFGHALVRTGPVWINLACRGSGPVRTSAWPAVP
jgi:hypothetical protein